MLCHCYPHCYCCRCSKTNWTNTGSTLLEIKWRWSCMSVKHYITPRPLLILSPSKGCYSTTCKRRVIIPTSFLTGFWIGRFSATASTECVPFDWKRASFGTRSVPSLASSIRCLRCDCWIGRWRWCVISPTMTRRRNNHVYPKKM